VDLSFEAYNGTLLIALYLSSTRPAELAVVYQDFARRFELPLRPSWPAHANNRDPERRLRIGYVSADFRDHSVAFFFEPLLAHHDRGAVEVYGYYNNTLQDAMTERLRSCTDHWIPCQGMTDEALAARIQADGIDILVDLAGHTRGNRLLVFARKPAPVQVTYLGYPATTGLSAIDYRLVTADTDPPGAEAWHSEGLYRLPRSLWCYRPAPDMPAVVPATPARRNGVITFGAMNNIAKVSEAAVAAWSGILRAVPGARLVMTSMPAGTARRDLQARLAAQGIAPERLTLHGKLPREEYYALLNEIDIALDPFPYNGTTTTCESLWMGVPVVTLIGETSAARSGYALLKGIGLDALAARDRDEYAGLAVALATDLDRLDTLRAGMRQRIAASPLRDEAGLTRDLEAAYRAMWRAWCAEGDGA
jgi:predicted O-linked N-acetylglucosamine transferase (SPINDLY family)